MSEMKLSPEQEQAIEQIKKEWLEELDEFERNPPPHTPNMLDGPLTWERVKIASKYHARMQAVIEGTGVEK